MGELVLVLVITWAFKHAWDHSRDDFKQSKANHRQKQPKGSKPKRSAELVHHDIGYWTHQGTHGFPAFRHGFGKGWHDARQKAATQREARAQAKAEHLETRASLAPQIAEARTRQRGAQAQIRSLRGPRWLSLPDAGDDTDGTCRYCGAEPGKPCDPDCPYLNQNWREVDRINAERTAQAAEEGSGEGSPEVQPDAAPPEDQPVQQEQPAPQEQQAPQETPPQGDSMTASSDVTYDGVLATLTAEARDVETRATEQSAALAHTQATGDAMQALNVDTQTLSAMADYEDAQNAAFKALARCMEASQHVAAVLTKGHGGLAEAHKDAPVEAAEREFYTPA